MVDCHQIYTFIGYEPVPKPLANSDTSFNYESSNCIITRSEYDQFLRKEDSLIAQTLRLPTRSDIHTLLIILSYTYFDPTNNTAQTITLLAALQAIKWLSNTSPEKVARTLGWPCQNTGPHIKVFIKAANQLLPGFELVKTNAEFSLNDYVRWCRGRNTELMKKARSWGVETLKNKRKMLFEDATSPCGLVPSRQDFQAKVSGIKMVELKGKLESFQWRLKNETEAREQRLSDLEQRLKDEKEAQEQRLKALEQRVRDEKEALKERLKVLEQRLKDEKESLDQTLKSAEASQESLETSLKAEKGALE